MKNVFKCVTDERLIIDIEAAGYGKDAITVKAAKVNGGDAFKITVEGKYKGRKNADGNPIPRVAFEKYVEDFKYTFSDDTTFAEDALFKSSTFTSKDYNLDKMVWDVTNGVIRISIPKTELARGASVAASDNADADSTGVPTSDAVTADAE